MNPILKPKSTSEAPIGLLFNNILIINFMAPQLAKYKFWVKKDQIKHFENVSKTRNDRSPFSLRVCLYIGLQKSVSKIFDIGLRKKVINPRHFTIDFFFKNPVH
jgi:hypothetical protein